MSGQISECITSTSLLAIQYMKCNQGLIYLTLTKDRYHFESNVEPKIGLPSQRVARSVSPFDQTRKRYASGLDSSCAP